MYLAGDAAPCAEGVPGTPASVAVVGCGAGAGAIAREWAEEARVLLCDACASAAGGAPGSGVAAPGGHGSAGAGDRACDADCREWAPPAQLGCCAVRGARSCLAPGGQVPAGSFDLVYLVAGVEGLDEYADAMGAWARTVGAPPVRASAVWRAQRARGLGRRWQPRAGSRAG